MPDAAADRVTHVRVGAVFGLLSAAAFGSAGPLGKSLLDVGWSPGAAVTARVSGAAVVLLVPALYVLRGRWHLLRRNAGLLAVYGVVAIAAVQLCFFNAVTTLSVGVALLIEYLAVVLVVVWLWVRHGRRPRGWTMVGISCSVVGLVLVLDVTGDVRVDLAGVLWALGGAVGLAGYFLLSGRDDTGLPPLVLAAGGIVVAAALLGLLALVGVLPMAYATTDVVLAGTALPWYVPVLGLGLVAAAIAYATGIAATRALGAKVAGFLGLTEVLFSVLLSWWLVEQLPLPVQLAGGALIVAGVLAVRYDELREPAVEEAAS